jgi:hypothetical protein
MKEIRLHREAPPKPSVGASCNGCGICCSIAPCPLSRLLLGHRAEACPALLWRDGRYVCGLVVTPRNYLKRLPAVCVPFASRLMRRWIAAGAGCDCDAEPE